MQPIVLVPGLLCSAEVFASQVAALWPFGPVTVASTLEGKTISEMAAAILAAAPSRFALVGFSMGGYICLEIMRQAPERILKLALLDTSARPDTAEQSQQRRALVAAARTGDFRKLVSETLTFPHPSRKDDANLREINLRMAMAVGVEGFARQTEAIITRIDSRPSLSAISVPTLVLVGDADPFTPPERSEEIAAAIPNARLTVVPHCGHGSTLEQPDAVNKALIEWIAGPSR
ncbi:alpha/beta fold hydrolase [Paraburkholderia xenovorans]|uniref:alpha/beta fold hydrolase n=1 Tax=Paraburkholderia xenovorans TaxID=36873 RepID=UPI0038BA5C13